jgi:signal transduction histidine kinase
MPVRLRITLLFSLLAAIILTIVFFIIYYFAHSSRTKYIDARLTNVAITTGRFLSNEETFNPELIQKIDSFTAIAFTHKTVVAYDRYNKKIYSFNDEASDAISVQPDFLNEVRKKGKMYVKLKDRDAVYYDYKDDKLDLVIVAAGYDVFGVQNIKELFFILLLSLIIGLAIALASGYFFSTQLLKPLGRIAEDITEISAQNLSRRMEVTKSKDEWNKLAITLNDLLNRLQESFEMQRRFIANASHELSTPITSISSQLQASLQKERSAQEYRHVMESVYKDVRNMGKLTSTLLEMARAAGDKGGLEFKLVRIDEVLLPLPSEIKKANPGYEVQMSFDNLPEDDQQLLVFGNETLLQSAIKNIIQNACKYANKKAFVRLKANEEHVFIEIEDKGKGIPRNELENIFEPFYRVEEDMQTEGFGLGLALVRRIIKLHRGTITVFSEQNKGTRFTILLPTATYLNQIQ